MSLSDCTSHGSYCLFPILNCCSLTKVLTEKNEEHQLWQPNHKTGSARSEGFYKISQKDKMKYLNNTKLATELPSTSTQVLEEIMMISGERLDCSVPEYILYLSRESASQPRRPHYVQDLISGLNSVACCLPSVVIVIWSNSISSR